MGELTQAFHKWAEDYGLDFEPLNNQSRSYDCLSAFKEGYAYARANIAAERARADALEAALSDVLEMAQEHADHFAAAFAGYKPERHAYYARALATARALLEKKT